MKDSDKVQLLAQAFDWAEAYGGTISRMYDATWIVTFPNEHIDKFGIRRDGEVLTEKFVRDCRFYGVDVGRWDDVRVEIEL